MYMYIYVYIHTYIYICICHTLYYDIMYYTLWTYGDIA